MIALIIVAPQESIILKDSESTFAQVNAALQQREPLPALSLGRTHHDSLLRARPHCVQPPGGGDLSLETRAVERVLDVGRVDEPRVDRADFHVPEHLANVLARNASALELRVEPECAQSSRGVAPGGNGSFVPDREQTLSLLDELDADNRYRVRRLCLFRA